MLIPISNWHETYYSLKEHLFLITAHRVYLRIDEPKGVISDEAEVFISRLENGDPDIVLMPKLTNTAKTAVIQGFIQSQPADIRVRLEQQWSQKLLDNWRPSAIDLWLYATTHEVQVCADWENYAFECCTDHVRAFLSQYNIHLADTAILNLYDSRDDG